MKLRTSLSVGLVATVFVSRAWSQEEVPPSEPPVEAAPDEVGDAATEAEAPAAEASDETPTTDPAADADAPGHDNAAAGEAEEPPTEGDNAPPARDEPSPLVKEPPAEASDDPPDTYQPSRISDASEDDGEGEEIASEQTLDTVSLVALMDTEVVSASKTAERIADAPSNIQVVTKKQIREWGSRDLKDVLRMLPGFPVIPDRDEWVFGARGSISDNNQKYLILIDGHRMNSWENFGPGQIIELPNDLSNVERIEIIRGPGSAVWGSDALAGVINIVTKDASSLEGDTAHMQATLGMNGMFRGNAQVGYEHDDDVSLMVMGGYAQEDGTRVTQSAATGLPLLDEESGYDTHPYGTYTTSLEKRRPGYFLQGKAQIKKLSINAYHFNTAVFNRHFEVGQGRANYLASDRYFVEAQYADGWEGGGVTTKVWTHENRNEYQPYKQGDSTQLPFNIVWLDRSFGTAADAHHQFNEVFDLAGGVDFQYTKFGPNQRINQINPDDPTVPTEGFWFDPFLEDRQLGGYAQARVKLFDSQLHLLAGARVDYNPDRGEDPANLNPRASIIYQPLDITTLKLLYNRGFLRPANFQSAGGTVSSESMDQVEFIWMQDVGPVSMTANVFWQQLTGSINILDGDLTGFANSGDVESIGGELTVQAPIGAHSVWANGSYTHATAGNFNADLPLNSQRVTPEGEVLSFPTLTANAGVTLRFLDDRLFITPMGRLVGESTYRETPPTDSLDDALYATAGPFFYLDATAGFDVTRTWTLSVHGFNLTNVTTPQALSIWNGTIEQYGAYVEGRIQAKF